MQVKIFNTNRYQTNSYLLCKEGKCLVIDPGPNTANIIKYLKENKMELLAILFTHAHFDHIEGSEALFKEYPQANIYLDEEDLVLLSTTKRGGCGNLGIDLNDYNYNNQKELPFSGKMIKAPGHTRGSAVFIFDNLLFSGDVLFKDDIGRVDLYNSDPASMQKTIQMLLKLTTNYIVYPGHGASTTLEKERLMLSREVQ